MGSSSFKHHELSLINPSFDSPLVDVLTELEYLRRSTISGSTPPYTFFQLKSIFHLLESLGSARIEGNHTTLADYVESSLEGSTSSSDQLKEIANIEKAMSFIEDSIQPGDDISQNFIRELHFMTVDGLCIRSEGDKTPGQYRQSGVKISQSLHLPPDAFEVPIYMDELVRFINCRDKPKYDFMKIAIAHHRFGWIHPFSNGNGRVVRLLTYAMMIKYGFNVRVAESSSAVGRLLNPTAVFCNDRGKYYEMLSIADKGDEVSKEQWCEYVLVGVLNELRKIDHLTDYDYLKEKILWPALQYARKREHITELELAILMLVVEQQVVKSSALSSVLDDSDVNKRSYHIKKLVDAKMLVPIHQGARQYSIGFGNSFLTRGVIRALTEEGFIPTQVQYPSA